MLHFFRRGRESRRRPHPPRPLFPNVPVVDYPQSPGHGQFNFLTPAVDRLRHLPPSEVLRASHSSTISINSSSSSASWLQISTTNAARGALICVLTVLGKAPLPGVGPATTALLQVISGIQDMADSRLGWQQLAERLERLWFLISQIQEIDAVEGQLNRICGRLVRQLKTLARDLQRANKRSLISRFFNSHDDMVLLQRHREELDSMIIDLTALFGAVTNLGAAQLREEFRTVIGLLHESQGIQHYSSSSSAVQV
ncbi:hypothetical protein C8J56DRAFT_1043528 [Mycena floridula]|nr:hypothetical protein C8J56DRAFT_1043528 [Mycena floridula]